MKILTKEELARRSDTELAVLHAHFTKLLMLAKRDSPEWHAAYGMIENIARVRATRRLNNSALRPF